MAQKTFKYPLVITGDYESIVPQLLALGYDFHPSSDRDDHRGFNDTLVTNLGGKVGILARLNRTVSVDNHNRTEVSASNPELVLALAAAVEEEEGQKGEYYVNFSGHGGFTKGNLYQLKTRSFFDGFAFVNDRGTPNGWSEGNYEHFSKATKEEIFNDFNTPKSSVSFEEAAEAAGAHDVDFSKLTPAPQKITVSVDFIKSLHEQVDEDIQEQIEEEFPNIFGSRPTFKAGDKIVLFPSYQELMIVAGAEIDGIDEDSETEIALVDLKDGLIKSESILVADYNKITERELIEAGERYGLTRCNYGKFSL